MRALIWILASVGLVVSGCSVPFEGSDDEGQLVKRLTLIVQPVREANASQPDARVEVYGRDADLATHRFAGRLHATLERGNVSPQVMDRKSLDVKPSDFQTTQRLREWYYNFTFDASSFPQNDTYRVTVAITMAKGSRIVEEWAQFYYGTPPSTINPLRRPRAYA